MAAVVAAVVAAAVVAVAAVVVVVALVAAAGHQDTRITTQVDRDVHQLLLPRQGPQLA